MEDETIQTLSQKIRYACGIQFALRGLTSLSGKCDCSPSLNGRIRMREEELALLA